MGRPDRADSPSLCARPPRLPVNRPRRVEANGDAVTRRQPRASEGALAVNRAAAVHSRQPVRADRQSQYVALRHFHDCRLYSTRSTSVHDPVHDAAERSFWLRSSGGVT